MIQLPRPVVLSENGSSVRLEAPKSLAAGIALVRIDHHQRFAPHDFYVESYATDLGLCGQSPCPAPLQIRATAWGGADVGPIRLAAGRYLVVLLAEQGTRVTARLQFDGLAAGVLHARATGARIGSLTIDGVTGSVAGHDLATRGYHMHYSKRRVFAGDMGMFAVGSPGTIDYQACGDIGAGPPPSGPTFCAQGGGLLPSPFVSGRVGQTLVGTGGSFAFGPPNSHYGLGYTISVAGPTVQRIRVASYEVVLPPA